VHDRAQALAAVEEAAQAFDTFNLDLMYALPGQTLAQCEADMRTALGFQPPHISIYHLTIEPNTVFAKFPPAGARGRRRLRDAGPHHRADRRGKGWSATRSRPTRGAATAAGTT
jgi:coproporphyrinogen III oxidase-like Fe-S oxidoreductase